MVFVAEDLKPTVVANASDGDQRVVIQAGHSDLGRTRSRGHAGRLGHRSQHARRTVRSDLHVEGAQRVRRLMVSPAEVGQPPCSGDQRRSLSLARGW